MSKLIPKPYFTLLVREDGEPWGIHFGDYDREVVEQERVDGLDCYHKRNMTIIKTGERQAEIDAAVAALNGGKA